MARGFARSLTSRDLHDVARLHARAKRLAGVHEDLTEVSLAAASDRTARVPRYTRAGDHGELVYPLVDSRGRPVAVLTLSFALAERADALAAGRREVLLAGVGAALLLVIGIGALARRLLVRPIEQLAASAAALAAGQPAEPLRWCRHDEVGALAASLDAIGGTMQALGARIEGLARQDPLTGVLNHRGLHDALHDALEGARDRQREGRRRRARRRPLRVAQRRRRARCRRRGAAHRSRVLLQGELRPGDVCGRIGGDEFLLALADSDAWGAERVVERLRSAVAAAPARSGGRRADASAPASPSSPATRATRSA